jgi:hypothetical protein
MINRPCPIPGPYACVCTLNVLVALGPLALPPDPALGINDVSLRELAIGWDNSFQEVLVRCASNVFDCAAKAGGWYEAFPAGARPLWAVLGFHLGSLAPPCLVEIRPPRTLILRPPDARNIIERWLRDHGFLLTPPKLS